MEKPRVTKQLAFIAMLFVCANFLLNVLAILFPETYFWMFGRKIDAELSVGIQMLMLADAACVLPLGCVCFYSQQQRSISENQAMGTLIMAVVCHFARSVGMILLHHLMVRMYSSASEVAVFSYINNARNIFSFCILAALVLICCAASIELYITKSITSKS